MTLLAMSIDHNLHKSYCMFFEIVQNSEEVVKLLPCSHFLSASDPHYLQKHGHHWVAIAKYLSTGLDGGICLGHKS